MEEMMREWMASQTKANERMKNQVVELENQINQGLRNHQAIIQNLERQFEHLVKKQPSKSLPRATNTKPRHEIDCTVHIPYTQEKVFEHDEISNHVGDKELISFVGIGNEVSKGNIKDTENSKRPNVSPSLVEYIPKIPYPQALKMKIADLDPGNGEGGCLEARLRRIFLMDTAYWSSE
ncbi:hypothetical protein Tco_0294822 [Tanacetum coccineum]